MKEKIRVHLNSLVSGLRNRWTVMPWPARAKLVAKTLLIVVWLLSLTWIFVWYVMGPASVEIGNVEVDLDRSLSLAGPDKDANGIRDDIDNYIKVLAEKKAYNGQQVRAIQQDARAMQGFITVDLGDAKAVRIVDNNNMKSVDCIFDLLGEDDGGVIGTQIEKMTANTKQRALAYIRFGHAMDGTVTTLPEDGCDK